MNIDWKLLAGQKATLVDIIANGILTSDQIEHLQGILHLTDEVQDTEAKKNPANVVFLGADGYFDGSGKDLGASEWEPGPQWRKLLKAVVDSEDDTGCDGLTVVDIEAWEALEEAWDDVP